MKIKSIIKIALILMVATLSIHLLSISSSAEIYEGECGNNLTWTLDTETGVLEIKGSGSMYPYTETVQPWCYYPQAIKTLILPGHLYNFSPEYFKQFVNCESIIAKSEYDWEMGNPQVYSSQNCLIDAFTNEVLLGCKTSVIPENATKIGDYAFYARPIESITIPKNVLYIGNYSFAECKSLKEIKLNGPVLTIGDSAFMNCASLENITLPSTVCSVGDHVFSGCSLKEFSFPSSLSHISSYMFDKCKLEKINIPNTVRTVGEYAFSECRKLKKVTMTDSVVRLGENTFYHCDSLADIKLSNSLVEIPKFCFTYCRELKSLTIPKNVTVIRNAAIYAADSLETLILPEGLITLEDRAVYENDVLKSVVIPASVKDLSPIAFSKKVKLTISSKNPYYYMGTGCIIEKAQKKLLIAYNDFVIPNDGSVTSIGRSAFQSTKINGKLVIPDSITYICKGAFSGNKGLTEIILSKNLKVIESSAFSECVNLTEIVLPEGLTSLGNSVFSMCDNLVSVYIPNSVTEFGTGMFIHCYSLKNVHLPENLTKIPERTFAASSIESITLPNSIQVIESKAFENCQHLQSIDLPSSLEYIGNHAFDYCTSVKEFVIPESVTYIGTLTTKNNSFRPDIVVIPENLDLSLYPATICELSYYGTIIIDLEEIAKDPSKFPLFNCGAVDNIALLKEYAINEPWCIFYDKSDKTISYNNKEYVLYILNDSARKIESGYLSSRNKYFFEDETGHWISNTEKKEHTFGGCAGICDSCNYMVETDIHSSNSAWGKDDTCHWRICPCCPEGRNIWNTMDHIWDKGKVTREPTEDTPGKIWHKCLECGQNKVFTIPQLSSDTTPEPTPDETEDTKAPVTPEETVPITPPTEISKPTFDDITVKNNILTILIVCASLLLITAALVLTLPVLKRKNKK